MSCKVHFSYCTSVRVSILYVSNVSILTLLCRSWWRFIKSSSEIPFRLLLMSILFNSVVNSKDSFPYRTIIVTHPFWLVLPILFPQSSVFRLSDNLSLMSWPTTVTLPLSDRYRISFVSEPRIRCLYSEIDLSLLRPLLPCPTLSFLSSGSHVEFVFHLFEFSAKNPSR